MYCAGNGRDAREGRRDEGRGVRKGGDGGARTARGHGKRKIGERTLGRIGLVKKKGER